MFYSLLKIVCWLIQLQFRYGYSKQAREDKHRKQNYGNNSIDRKENQLEGISFPSCKFVCTIFHNISKHPNLNWETVSLYLSKVSFLRKISGVTLRNPDNYHLFFTNFAQILQNETSKYRHSPCLHSIYTKAFL